MFHEPAFIYPYVPAMAATLLRKKGHSVRWMDGPALGMSWNSYLTALKAWEPDIVAWEAKTPSIKKTWKCVDRLKEAIPSVTSVLMGDHVTALPGESFTESYADIVLQGGDYDFGLVNLVADMESGKEVVGVYEAGTSGDLSTLPVVDRHATQWWLYGFEKGSGNYKYLPGTHTMIGRDCWWRHEGGCTFCSWTNLYKNWRVGTVNQFMAEIEDCHKLGIREVFDDTGTFPIGSWLDRCCKALTQFNEGKRHGKAKVTIGCNMRPGALKQSEYDAMGKAGFRFILYGLESANHSTLVRINKGQSEGDIIKSVRMAKRAGLEPHVTCMVGYPWETRDEAAETIRLTQALFKEGSIDTLQATVVIPYPGTELFRQCEENGWLKYGRDWDMYDMRRPVMTCPMSDEEVLKITRGVYKAFISPQYITRKIVSIRSVDDLRFIQRGMRLLWGHLRDFMGGKHDRAS